MGGVFINYRSADNPLGAAGIHDALAARFGSDRVFRDCVSLEAGDSYPDAIREALADADVLVAIVGPGWLSLTDPKTGQRLIDRESDWVRRELAWAHERNIRVVPVLLEDTPAHAVQPAADELPPDIRWFAHVQAFEFSQRRFGADLDRLAARLTMLVPTLTTNGRTSSPTAVLSSSAFVELVTALEAIPCVQNDSTRALVVSRLRPTIAGAIPHYPRRRAHVIGILATCLNYEHGITDLVAVITEIEQTDSLPFQQLVQILRRHLPGTTFPN
jgi:hypothetical protein